MQHFISLVIIAIDDLLFNFCVILWGVAMRWSAKTVDVVMLSSGCLVVGMFEGEPPKLLASGKHLDQAAKQQISSTLERGDWKGCIGESQLLYHLPGIKAERVLLLGLGVQSDFTASAARRAVQVAVKLLIARGISSADFCLLEATYEGADGLADSRRRTRNLVEAAGHAMYSYSQTKSSTSLPKLKQSGVLCERADLPNVKRGISEGMAIARAVTVARDYSNLPGNICTPSFLASEAKQMAKKLGITTTILSEAEMKRHKMGALLSVSRGSHEPAKLIVMEYAGGKRDAPPVVLVGKGLTFDAGGISLKPAAAMDEMKYDMCGGASVFGAVHAAAELALEINLVGIVPSSENLPGGAANKPGDIVTAMNGTTIEILNTDAEGRLILCDALTYAARFKPSVVVDIATLTGACKVALGQPASGLFSNCDTLASELTAAGEVSGDRVWRMPIWDDYDQQLKSNFADLANIGGSGAGAVTAACFLKHFAKSYRWAHLDIAASAWLSGAKKGATGRPVPLLVEFLLQR